MNKPDILHNAKKEISALPEDLLNTLKKNIPQITTEKAHAYPASVLQTLTPADETIIDWKDIAQQYARIYVNLPWCKSKCIYCRYPEAIGLPDKQSLLGYFHDLDKEFTLYKQHLKTDKILSETLYIGGGTPSLLSAEHLNSLFNLLDNHLVFKDRDHRIFEVSPSTLTQEKMDIIKKHKINRISIGIQTLNNEVLKQCLREDEHYAEVKRAVALIQEARIPQLNMDIMLGLPGQTLEIFIEDLLKIIELAPTSISFLDMEIWPGSMLYEQGKTKKDERWKKQLEMTSAYQMIMEEAGYIARRSHYYVTPQEMKLPNRKAYFDTRIDGFQIGVGARSLSHIKNVITRNVSLEAYHQKMQYPALPIDCGAVLSPQEMEIIRIVRGICETKIVPKKSRDLFEKELLFLKDNDLIDGNYTLTKKGRLLESELLYLFYPA